MVKSGKKTETKGKDTGGPVALLTKKWEKREEVGGGWGGVRLPPFVFKLKQDADPGREFRLSKRREEKGKRENKKGGKNLKFTGGAFFKGSTLGKWQKHGRKTVENQDHFFLRVGREKKDSIQEKGVKSGKRGKLRVKRGEGSNRSNFREGISRGRKSLRELSI